MIRNWILKVSDGLFGPPACRIIAHLIAMRGRSKSPQGWKPDDPKRILLIRPGGIGDMIVLLPALSALSKAFPKAAIDIVCEQRNLAVVELSNIRVRCLPYDKRPLRFLMHLMATDYDIAIDSEQFHHASAVFAALSGASARIGFNINPRRNGLYTHLIPYSPDSFEGTEFLSLLSPLGLENLHFHPAAIAPQHPADELDTALAEKIREFKKSGKRVVVVHSGGSVERKLWPINKLADLAARIADQPESAVIILGARSDARRTATIMSSVKAKENVLSLSDSLTLRQCAALIAMSSLFIGPDSGLLHLAVACDVPTVSIFGPSDHKKWGYGGSGRHVVARNDLPCSPCFIFGYSKPCRSYECIEGISVDDVAKACSRAAAS